MMSEVKYINEKTEGEASAAAERCLVVLNEESGTIKELLAGDAVLEKMETSLRNNGWDPHIRTVPGEKIDETVKEGIADKVPCIFAGGGDGTTSSIAKLLMGTEVTMGILPFGTLNLAARDLDAPLDPWDALAAMKPGKTREIDVLKVGDKVCLCVSVMGVYTKLLRMGQEFHGRSWWMKFFHLSKNFFRAFLSSAPMNVEMTIGASAKRQIRTRLLFIIPGGYEDTWGLIPSKQSFELGRCVVLAAKHLSIFGISKFIVRFLAGRARTDPELETLEAENIEVRVKRKGSIWLAIDGELSKHELPVRFELQKKALRVVEPTEGE